MILELLRLSLVWLVCGVISYLGFNTIVPYGIAGIIPLIIALIWTIHVINIINKSFKESKEFDKLLNDKKQNPTLPKDEK